MQRADPFHLTLAYETFRDAGSTYHVVIPIRLQRNAAFHGDYNWVEDGNEEYLRRLKLNPTGSLYKGYDSDFTISGGAEKKTRKWEGKADLLEYARSLRATSGTRRKGFLYDRVDIAAMVNYLAAMIVTGGVDCCYKNYYVYHDNDDTDQWQFLPWDVDLTFGRNWTGTLTYYDDKMYADNGLDVGVGNFFIDALFADTAFKQMYYRRIRTLMDQLLQPTNTPAADLHYEGRMRTLYPLLSPDADLDIAKWKTWGKRQTLSEAMDLMFTNYFPARRKYVFQSMVTPRGPVPASQAPGLAIGFGAVEVTPVSGNSDEEFVELRNTNAVYVDISGWKISGDIEHRIAGGTVIPPKGSLYLTPRIAAFRNRSEPPRGGQGLFAQGAYHGHFSARGGILTLLDGSRVVATTNLPANPTPAQQDLRITEIQFRPAPVHAGDPYPSEDYQFIELANLGSGSLDLSHVSFTAGIDFSFANGGTRTLEPGARTVVARNIGAFRLRYGSRIPVAGEFRGKLDPDGESVRLDDLGEGVLDFAYDGNWLQPDAAPGTTLVITNPNADWTAWKTYAQWTSGSNTGGTPGVDDSAFAAWVTQRFAAGTAPDRNAPLADPDGDGLSNLDEFLEDSDPTDPASPLWLQPGGVDSKGAARFQFNAVAGRAYTVEFRDELGAAGWALAESIPAGAARTVTVQAVAGAGKSGRFYRVTTGAVHGTRSRSVAPARTPRMQFTTSTSTQNHQPSITPV